MVVGLKKFSSAYCILFIIAVCAISPVFALEIKVSIDQKLPIKTSVVRALGGKLWCHTSDSTLLLNSKNETQRKKAKWILAKLKQFAASNAAPKSHITQAQKAVLSCANGQVLPPGSIQTPGAPTPTATPIKTETVIPSPTPTQTPTPTPIDLCRGDKFLWNVGNDNSIPAFNLSAAPHIRQNRVGILNMGWNGMLPTVVEDSQGQRNRLAWLHIPYVVEGPNLIINGGTPIMGDLAVHLQHLEHDLDSSFPDHNFDGYIVIDFEAWWPQWEWNTWGDWQQRAIQQVRTLYPELTLEQATARTIQLWEEKGLAIYLETQRLIQRVRPNAKVAWYDSIYRAYWDGYATSNGAALRAMNNKFLPIHREADFLIADIYQFYSSATDANGDPIARPPQGGVPPNGVTYFENNRAYVEENVRETQRLAVLAGHKPVMAYTWPRYHDSASPDDRYHLVRKTELFLQMVYPLLLGVDQVTIWGNEISAVNSNYYGNMQTYLNTTFGPMVEAYCRADLSSYQKLLNAISG